MEFILKQYIYMNSQEIFKAMAKYVFQYILGIFMRRIKIY